MLKIIRYIEFNSLEPAKALVCSYTSLVNKMIGKNTAFIEIGCPWNWFISSWSLHLSIGTPMMQTSNFQYIGPALGFRSVISNFLL